MSADQENILACIAERGPLTLGQLHAWLPGFTRRDLKWHLILLGDHGKVTWSGAGDERRVQVRR